MIFSHEKYAHQVLRIVAGQITNENAIVYTITISKKRFIQVLLCQIQFTCSWT